MIWGTTDYPPAEGCHSTGRPWGDREACPFCGEPYYAQAHRTVEVHRDLTPAELPGAVFAVEASDDNERTYASNGLRWASPEDAKSWASGLALRWFGCTHIRVVEVTPPAEDRNGYTVVRVVHQTL